MSDARVWRRRALALGGVALVLVLGYLLWLRDSSLFAVDDVTVEGVTANQEEVTAALEEAAQGMTTLHVKEGELAQAVSSFPTVASISADAGLFHSLTIKVTERLPVGAVKVEGEAVAVSADGFLLTGLETQGQNLPTMDADVAAGRLNEEGLAQAAILGGAPAELRERITETAFDIERGGVVVDLEGAPELRFADGEEAESKWRAVAAVLADRQLGSPAYLDVSVPERPVTGG
jgi:cell division protein FtsQ